MDLDFAMAASGLCAAVRRVSDPAEPYVVMPCQDGKERAFTVVREETALPWAYSFRNWRPASLPDVAGLWEAR